MVATTTTFEKRWTGQAAGQIGTIVQFTDERLASKLLSMGILPGSQLELVRRAPLGGGWYVKVENRQYVALRKQELACIVMK